MTLEDQALEIQAIKKPLSAYNIFFKYWRNRMLNDTAHLGFPIDAQVVAQIPRDHENAPKRAHRKSTHGKVTFLQLSRCIGAAWKRLSPREKAIFDLQAKTEKRIYAARIQEVKNRTVSSAETRLDFTTPPTIVTSCQAWRKEESSSVNRETRTFSEPSLEQLEQGLLTIQSQYGGSYLAYLAQQDVNTGFTSSSESLEPIPFPSLYASNGDSAPHLWADVTHINAMHLLEPYPLHQDEEESFEEEISDSSWLFTASFTGFMKRIYIRKHS